MSDQPPTSPVDSATPVAGAKPPLSSMKIGLLVCAGAGVLMIGPHAFNWIRGATQPEPKQVAEPAAGPGQKYTPPALPTDEKPKVERAVAKVPPMPVENLAGPGQPQMDPRIAARLSDIGGSAGGGSPVPVTPAAASSEHPPVRPVLPDMTGTSALSKNLTPTTLVASRATEIPNPRFTIEQGRVLQCTQQTKINTSFPGGVTAILPEGVRGETGDVTLLDPGSRVFGTIEHGMINGLDRAFVLWQNITTPVMYDPDGTPRQLRVTVNSPAADQLGQGGLDGDVNRHYLRKFGAAIAFSLLQGGLQAGTAALASGGGGSGNLNSNYLNFQSGDQVASQALSATVNIPDVLTRDQGLPCSIFVMRDLVIDAYKLKVR